jgi:hypothetical protein
MKAITTLAAIAFAAPPVFAEMNSYDLAQFVASSIVGAEVCGYTLSDDAVQAFIASRVETQS